MSLSLGHKTIQPTSSLKRATSMGPNKFRLFKSSRWYLYQCNPTSNCLVTLPWRLQTRLITLQCYHSMSGFRQSPAQILISFSVQVPGIQAGILAASLRLFASFQLLVYCFRVQENLQADFFPLSVTPPSLPTYSLKEREEKKLDWSGGGVGERAYGPLGWAESPDLSSLRIKWIKREGYRWATLA